MYILESRWFSEFWVKLVLLEYVACFWWGWACLQVCIRVCVGVDKYLGTWCTTIDVSWVMGSGWHAVIRGEKCEELPSTHSGFSCLLLTLGQVCPHGTIGIWGQVILCCRRWLTASLTILQWHPGSLQLWQPKMSADTTKLFLIESHCVKGKEKIPEEMGQYRAFGLKLFFLF